MGRGRSGSSDYISAGNKAGVTSAQNRTINRIIKKTRDLKKEQLRLVNEDGEVVLEKRGAKYEVATTYGEKRELSPGAISIHNHPHGGTFSEDDLNDFGFGVRQSVIASPDGTYRLTNLNWKNRQKRTAGWYDMREALRESGATQERGILYFRDEARKLPSVMRIQKRLQAVSEKYLAARSRGAAQSVIDSLMGQYETISLQYKTALRRAERKLEVKPYDDFFRANARKYGFAYTFTPR